MTLKPEDQETVWRVCHGADEEGRPCKRCAPVEVIDGEECVRGCYLHASELVNIVQTGNPWRKTEGVSEPWTTLPVARERVGVAQIVDPEAFCDAFAGNCHFHQRRESALTKADAILNLIGGDGWKPIETAPKDGTPILLWGNHKGDEHLTSGAIVGCWNVMTDAGGWRAYGDFVPTHWRPLPPPPPVTP